ncbi:hypothetical protein C4K68_12705 [Pokkaliibacter plantistimulans]|uniref:Uncharacterized protein n=1 Tax=Proteobacteria bacterium 228 TaxID=2083153 RepID=A0A2S5KR19_9PROT|nr:hypothetical protein [Pokkaliibacter plantistimulans]PPC76969.1 hypothetical protein C4K68_12705 [Pokkaliibacter plantistimulans]
MKLGNTKTEKELRVQLEASYASLAIDGANARLRNALKEAYPEYTGGCVLHWTPDQSDDLFVVLVNGSKLISVELDRLDTSASPIIEHIPLSQYKIRLKKSNKIKLEIALEIVGN